MTPPLPPRGWPDSLSSKNSRSRQVRPPARRDGTPPVRAGGRGLRDHTQIECPPRLASSSGFVSPPQSRTTDATQLVWTGSSCPIPPCMHQLEPNRFNARPPGMPAAVSACLLVLRCTVNGCDVRSSYDVQQRRNRNRRR
jgi:hypothetical protein